MGRMLSVIRTGEIRLPDFYGSSNLYNFLIKNQEKTYHLVLLANEEMQFYSNMDEMTQPRISVNPNNASFKIEVVDGDFQKLKECNIAIELEINFNSKSSATLNSEKKDTI